MDRDSKSPDAARRAKLAQALRDNLKRRKAAPRPAARAEPKTPPGD